MICAIEPPSLAHQWRKALCADDKGALRINPWRIGRAIGFLLTAHQWRMTAHHLPQLNVPPVLTGTSTTTKKERNVK